MSVTWRQGRVTQVVCLPEEAGCFPGSSGAVFHTAWVPSTASSLHSLPQEMSRPGDSCRMSKSLRRPSPCPKQQHGQSSDAREERRNVKKTRGCWFNDLPSCTQPPSQLFPLPLCFSQQTLAPFWKGQPAVQTECVPLSDREYLGTKNTY